jgi:hypothetical protein
MMKWFQSLNRMLMILGIVTLIPLVGFSGCSKIMGGGTAPLQIDADEIDSGDSSTQVGNPRGEEIESSATAGNPHADGESSVFAGNPPALRLNPKIRVQGMAVQSAGVGEIASSETIPEDEADVFEEIIENNPVVAQFDINIDMSDAIDAQSHYLQVKVGEAGEFQKVTDELAPSVNEALHYGIPGLCYHFQDVATSAEGEQGFSNIVKNCVSARCQLEIETQVWSFLDPALECELPPERRSQKKRDKSSANKGKSLANQATKSLINTQAREIMMDPARNAWLNSIVGAKKGYEGLDLRSEGRDEAASLGRSSRESTVQSSEARHYNGIVAVQRNILLCVEGFQAGIYLIDGFTGQITSILQADSRRRPSREEIRKKTYVDCNKIVVVPVEDGQFGGRNTQHVYYATDQGLFESFIYGNYLGGNFPPTKTITFDHTQDISAAAKDDLYVLSLSEDNRSRLRHYTGRFNDIFLDEYRQDIKEIEALAGDGVFAVINQPGSNFLLSQYSDGEWHDFVDIANTSEYRIKNIRLIGNGRMVYAIVDKQSREDRSAVSDLYHCSGFSCTLTTAEGVDVKSILALNEKGEFLIGFADSKYRMTAITEVNSSYQMAILNYEKLVIWSQ